MSCLRGCQRSSKCDRETFFSIVERSRQLVELPNGWRKANITPVFGRGRQEGPGNIKLLSLNLVPRKVTDKIFLEAISQHTHKGDWEQPTKVKWTDPVGHNGLHSSCQQHFLCPWDLL